MRKSLIFQDVKSRYGGLYSIHAKCGYSGRKPMQLTGILWSRAERGCLIPIQTALASVE